MSVYQKLNAARKAFHEMKLEKTGKNTFAGYSYFELGDFLLPALSCFEKAGLCGVVSFTKDEARMTIVDMEKPDSTIVITSPMGSAALKGCHEVQNIGAVETYQRRYLWVAALEIVEHDALDATTGRDKPEKKVISATGGVMQTLPQARQSAMVDYAEAIKERMAADDVIGAYELYLEVEDVEEKTALWGLLDSKIRSAIKRHGDSLKGH